jgi:hypothetical protein
MEGIEHVDSELHAQPGLCLESKGALQPQRGIHRYRTFAVDDLGQPRRRDADPLREVGLRQMERLEKFAQKNFAGQHWPSMRRDG